MSPVQKKKYGNKWSSCSEYTIDSIKYLYLSWREYVLCTGGMILLSVHWCQQQQFVNSSVHHLLHVFIYAGSVLFCEQKWTWILVSFVNGKVNPSIKYDSTDKFWHLSPDLEHSGTGLGPIILVPDWFRHRHFCSFRKRWPDAGQSGIQAFKRLYESGKG